MAQAAGQNDRAPRGRPETVVGAGVVVRGDIEGATDLTVHGMVIGKVAVADLTVDREAMIDGPVTAEAVVVSGRVLGPVKARSVLLASTARVEGDVTCEHIQIEVGARFMGRCLADDDVDQKLASATPAEVEGEGAQGEAGQELLRLAARVRRVAG